MTDKEIKILDRFETPAGLMFTVKDDGQYRVDQTVAYHGAAYTITGIKTNSSLNVIGLRVVRKG